MTSSDGLPELPGINKADGLQRMMNKAALYEKVLRDFHARFRDEPTHIRKALTTGNFPEAERRAHSLKGLAGTIGAPALQHAAEELESTLRTGEIPSAAVFAQCESELAVVIAGIACAFGIDQRS